MTIPEELKNEIWEYCRANNISNIDDFTIKMVKQGFTVEKFGATPYTKEPKVIEKIVEKVKEVPVEKKNYVTDDKEVEALTNENRDLKSNILSLEDKIKELVNELKISSEKNNNDIYGEGRKGLLGSNTIDLYEPNND